MHISVTQEAFAFVCFVLCGGLLYFCYDLFFLVRKQSGAKGLMLHVQDGLFWLCSLCILFCFVFFVCRGRVRFYEFLGAALGAVLYGLTLSKPIRFLLCRFFEIFFKIFKKFSKILLTPLAFMYNIIYRCVIFVYRPMRKLLRSIKTRIYTGFKRALSFSGRK